MCGRSVAQSVGREGVCGCIRRAASGTPVVGALQMREMRRLRKGLSRAEGRGVPVSNGKVVREGLMGAGGDGVAPTRGRRWVVAPLVLRVR